MAKFALVLSEMFRLVEFEEEQDLEVQSRHWKTMEKKGFVKIRKSKILLTIQGREYLRELSVNSGRWLHPVDTALILKMYSNAGGSPDSNTASLFRQLESAGYCYRISPYSFSKHVLTGKSKTYSDSIVRHAKEIVN